MYVTQLPGMLKTEARIILSGPTSLFTFSFCRPSRGPTSTIFTRFGKVPMEEVLAFGLNEETQVSAFSIGYTESKGLLRYHEQPYFSLLNSRELTHLGSFKIRIKKQTALGRNKQGSRAPRWVLPWFRPSSLAHLAPFVCLSFSSSQTPPCPLIHLIPTYLSQKKVSGPHCCSAGI